MSKTENKSEPSFKHSDTRILRECLAWTAKQAPPMIQKKIISDLARFAKSVAPYCTHFEKVWIEREQKLACLDCGKRVDRLSLVE